ncbi:nuclear transport factor 2 family protein [Thalassotalea euphylliae]|nr:nuclear transport factor 2 family protein [Thalassotalea euphylliae]
MMTAHSNQATQSPERKGSENISQNRTQQLTQDEAKIRSTIYSFSALADQSAFEYLGALFAPEVTLDYTELFGGEVQIVTNQALMQQWAGFLPGFDTTFHELSNMRVSQLEIAAHQKSAQQNSEHQKNAQVNVDFTASHWLGKSYYWSISGEYQFTLANYDGHWVIQSAKLFAKSESGSREVLEKVAPFAAEKLAAKRQRLITIQ